jgi:hypothetical protein
VQRFTLAQNVLLGVVDRFLTGKDAEPERDRQRPGDQRDQRGQPIK